jgi:DNA-binding MarR family transcriptional regulator
VQTVSFFGRQLRRVLSELAEPLGLSDTACLVLWACAEGPSEGLAQHELAPLVGVSPAQLSGLVEQLYCQGWLLPRRPAHDRRRQYWRLTPEGVQLVDRLLDAVAARLIDTAILSPAEHSHLVSQLTELSAALAPVAPQRRKEAA